MDNYAEADNVITDLKKSGYDYSSRRDDIEQLFTNVLYQGNWDGTTYWDESDGVKNLRLIQEGEFDQHSEGIEDCPQFDDQLTYSAGHYVFFA